VQLPSDHELGRLAAIGPPDITLQTYFAPARRTFKSIERTMRTSGLDTMDQFHGSRAAMPAPRYLNDVAATDTGEPVVRTGTLREQVIP